VYWLAHNWGGNHGAASAAGETTPVKAPAKVNALQKYVEVSGIRFVESPKHEVEARFVIINHSDADISGLTGTVNIWGRTAKSEEEAAGNFAFQVPAIGPNESKELTAPLRTKLKVYELPDWQNVSADVQVTGP
jgi:hypothetical protein